MNLPWLTILRVTANSLNMLLLTWVLLFVVPYSGKIVAAAVIVAVREAAAEAEAVIVKREVAGRKVSPANGMTVGSALSSQTRVVRIFSATSRLFVTVTVSRKVMKSNLR